MNRKTVLVLGMALVFSVVPTLFSCSRSESGGAERSEQEAAMSHPGGPQLGKPGGGPAIDKSGDSVLQAMIATVVPKFRQLEYTDSETGKTMKYNLYTPAGGDDGAMYPLVLFMADASTPGDNPLTPLTQGYGALVWATDEWQAEHPCYVLVPHFSGVAVNDAYQHTDEVDMVIGMLRSIEEAHNDIDSRRLYTTGQSMGGMISMYYNVAYPDVFAASIFVDCHWDTATFPELVRHKFVYFIAGTSGKAAAEIKPMEEAAEQVEVDYTYAEWSARLPEARQCELAATMLAKGAPVNLFQFESGTVLPSDGRGSEHMYSFDYAYRIASVRTWLFEQSR